MLPTDNNSLRVNIKQGINKKNGSFVTRLKCNINWK